MLPLPHVWETLQNKNLGAKKLECAFRPLPHKEKFLGKSQQLRHFHRARGSQWHSSRENENLGGKLRALHLFRNRPLIGSSGRKIEITQHVVNCFLFFLTRT